jgi:SNF2 family DNA or RNA helicase
LRAFRAGKVPLFPISLEAGGTSLNLAAADTEDQATARGNRIGKDSPVSSTELVVEGTFENACPNCNSAKTRSACRRRTVYRKSVSPH